MKTLFGVPLVATIHATERGRHGGHVPPGLPGAINAVEWWLTYQAREVIACSRFMVREVVHGFELPPEKVHLVPNGVDVDLWKLSTPGDRPTRNRSSWRGGASSTRRASRCSRAPIGELRHRVPGIRCVIAGRGTYLPELQTQIDMEGVSDLVHLAGLRPRRRAA